MLFERANKKSALNTYLKSRLGKNELYKNIKVGKGTQINPLAETMNKKIILHLRKVINNNCLIQRNTL